MDEEINVLKERLRAAGVNRIIAGIDTEKNDSEDPNEEYGAEDDENDVG